MPQCRCDHGANIGARKIPRNNYLFETMMMQHTPRMRRIHFLSSICALATETQKHKREWNAATSMRRFVLPFGLNHLGE